MKEVSPMTKMERNATTTERLQEAMRDTGKKQIDLARETGLSHSTISRYISGAVEPRQDATHKLSVVLGVSEMWLWGYDVPKQRTAEQKKNDDLVQVIAKLRKSPVFYEVVSVLAELSEEECASVKPLLEVLRSRR
jgi:transcriptional regulator with XRE-family HTH domain